ncbi:MAG: hypothetical protein GC162_20770 [Planctomycetes bacterium]|nr:hypothetical protein [Planctomycetota bacterium]
MNDSLPRLALALLIMAVASRVDAALLTVGPLANASFESPATAVGTQNETMTSWTSSGIGSRVETPTTATFSNQFSTPTRNVPDGDQEFVLFYGSVAGQQGFAYQILQGTTDANPALHNLTVNEVAGRSIEVSFWVGRGLTVSTYEDQNMRFLVGLQNNTAGTYQSTVKYDKLASSQAGTIVLGMAKDEWRQVTATLSVPTTPSNGTDLLRLMFLVDSTNTARSTHIDAVAVKLVPTPAALPAGLSLLGLLTLRRRR